MAGRCYRGPSIALIDCCMHIIWHGKGIIGKTEFIVFPNLERILTRAFIYLISFYLPRKPFFNFFFNLPIYDSKVITGRGIDKSLNPNQDLGFLRLQVVKGEVVIEIGDFFDFEFLVSRGNEHNKLVKGAHVVHNELIEFDIKVPEDHFDHLGVEFLHFIGVVDEGVRLPLVLQEGPVVLLNGLMPICYEACASL